MIKDVAYVAYASDDVAATRAWYERVLGLQFAGPYVEDGIEKYNEAHLATGCFALMASEWVGRRPGSCAGVFFEVDDIVGAVQRLRDQNVVVDEIWDGPVCKQTWLSDPEGNRIALHQSKVAPVPDSRP